MTERPITGDRGCHAVEAAHFAETNFAFDVVGKLFAPGVDAPYLHERVWAREESNVGERLRIGGGERSVELLVSLAQGLAEPLFILAVLRVGRATGQDGKFESEALSHVQVADFYDEFEELFARDGRVQGWIGATDGSGLLVLDEHDLVYAYGPLDAFERELRLRGYSPGDPDIPVPHGHAYSEELDQLEVQLVNRQWRRVLPLDEEEGTPS